MKRFLLMPATIIIVCFGCTKMPSFKITGEIPGQTSGYVYINKIELNTPILIDSAKIDGKGFFKIKIKTTIEPDFYQVSLSSDNFITLLAKPGENINLTFSGQQLFDNYIVNGSEESEKLRTIDQTLIDTKKQLDSLSAVYSRISSDPNFATEGHKLDSMFNDLVRKQRMKNIEFIINNLTSLATIKAIYQRIDPETYVLFEPRDLQYMKIASDSLRKYYPNSRHVQALIKDFDKEFSIFTTNQYNSITERIEPVELNPDLINVDGKRVSLNSLRGKHVLLTFWSAQSRDCVQENLDLKQFHKLYSKKGFEIYQINLDADEELWKDAVKFDELPWISVREDDPANPQIARLFNVRELPANYFFDKQGNIVATNLHGRQLKIKLEQLFGN